jgi:hypothetical protein
MKVAVLPNLKPQFWLKRHFFFHQSVPLPLLCFFIPPFFGTTPQTTHSLYNILERQTQGNSLLLTFMAIFILP